MYLKKYGLSVNGHCVNIAENIPEIDVQIHLPPKDNLFFFLENYSSLTSYGRDQTNHRSKIPDLSWNLKTFIRRTDLKLPPDAGVHCSLLPLCTCPLRPLAPVERSVCLREGLNGFIWLVLIPIGPARAPQFKVNMTTLNRTGQYLCNIMAELAA